MKYYEVHGKGLALGAVAVVLAESEDDAHEKTKHLFPDGTTHDIQELKPEDGVIYFWNGDY